MSICLPACLHISNILAVLQASGSIFLFLQIAILPCFTLSRLCLRLEDTVLSPFGSLFFFFFYHASSEGLHVCVALRIGNLLWGQGGYGLVFVSRLFLNSLAGRLDWLLKLSLPGVQD